MNAVEGARASEQLLVAAPRRATSLALVDLPDVLRVDVAEVVGGALELLSVTRRLRGVQVSLDLPEEPVPANVSHRRLQQVLLLLLAHAADAANGQGVRVVVDAADDFGDEPPRFQVQIAGASLSARELQAVLLSPMLVGPLHRKLARARELTESMGGTLAVSSAAKVGITVTVELPAPGMSSW
ncbi:ATP-binding protein [Corallococcus macrosporus]|uniref:ATP-binding protein n=1 Tax=Corallococcus macrosporus TaxID=35 RepID=UPI000BB3BF24|nr:ATP-binding protein [Corallococcus macrosporus]